MAASRDPDLVRAVAAYIGEYRSAGGYPALMKEAALAAYPSADVDTFDAALTLANAQERARGTA